METILASDKNLEEAAYQSKIVDIKTGKNGSISKNNRILSSSQLKELSNFALKLLKDACERILNGEITPNPLGKNYANCSCSKCAYKAVCGFNELYGNEIREEIKVGKFEDFKNIVEGGNEVE